MDPAALVEVRERADEVEADLAHERPVAGEALVRERVREVDVGELEHQTVAVVGHARRLASLARRPPVPHLALQQRGEVLPRLDVDALDPIAQERRVGRVGQQREH